MESMKKFCIGFAIFHLLAFISFLIFLQTQTGVAQYQFYWIFWLIADFPVSLLFFAASKLGVVSYAFMLLLHGVLGTVWWYFLPVVLVAIDPRSRKKPNHPLERDGKHGGDSR